MYFRVENCRKVPFETSFLFSVKPGLYDDEQNLAYSRVLNAQSPTKHLRFCKYLETLLRIIIWEADVSISCALFFISYVVV